MSASSGALWARKVTSAFRRVRWVAFRRHQVIDFLAAFGGRFSPPPRWATPGHCRSGSFAGGRASSGSTWRRRLHQLWPSASVQCEIRTCLASGGSWRRPIARRTGMINKWLARPGREPGWVAPKVGGDREPGCPHTTSRKKTEGWLCLGSSSTSHPPSPPPQVRSAGWMRSVVQNRSAIAFQGVPPKFASFRA